MPELDPIWICAREDLVLVDSVGPRDEILWDHAVRVDRACGRIVECVEGLANRIDRRALSAAAAYHEAFRAVEVRSGQLDRACIFDNPASPSQRDTSTGLMQRRLNKILPAASLALAREAIEGLNQRHSDLREGHVLCDAELLDELGPLLLNRIVRALHQGDSIDKIVNGWRTRKEYGYYDQRLGCCHFPVARKAAQQRLQHMDTVMAALDEQQGALDVGGRAPSSGVRGTRVD